MLHLFLLSLRHLMALVWFAVDLLYGSWRAVSIPSLTIANVRLPISNADSTQSYTVTCREDRIVKVRQRWPPRSLGRLLERFNASAQIFPQVDGRGGLLIPSSVFT